MSDENTKPAPQLICPILGIGSMMAVGTLHAQAAQAAQLAGGGMLSPQANQERMAAQALAQASQAASQNIGLPNCVREKCALWTGQECAIKAISERLTVSM